MKSAKTPSPYTLTQMRSMRIQGQNTFYFTKPGAPDWLHPNPAALLLAEHSQPQPGEKILLMNSGQAIVPTYLARIAPEAEIWLMDTSFVALQLAGKSLAHSEATNVHLLWEFEHPQDWEGSFDQVLLCLSKGRKLAQRRLLSALAVLKPGGKLLLSGQNDLGIKSIFADAAEVFDQVTVLGYKKGCRVGRGFRSGRAMELPEWALQPGIQPGTWHSTIIDSPAGQFELDSLVGIFSYDRLDDGTRLLLSNLGMITGLHVLDLGCGYGVIGFSAAAAGAARVDLVDDNLLAVAAARRNAQKLGMEVSVIASDVCSELHGRRYDLVLSNPPFHRGGQVDYDIAHAIIQQSAEVLQPGGRLILVANRFIPYDEVMKSFFSKVLCLASNPRFHLLEASK